MGLTPLDSVLNTPLWEVMEMISLKVAKVKTQQDLMEIERKKFKK